MQQKHNVRFVSHNPIKYTHRHVVDVGLELAISTSSSKENRRANNELIVVDDETRVEECCCETTASTSSLAMRVVELFTRFICFSL